MGLQEKLRESGLKLTPQRLAILDYLEGNHAHPTAAQIFQDLKSQYPTMSMATVYNTVGSLVKLGLIRELKIDKEHSSYDFEVEPHHHFLCRNCGLVKDVGLEAPPPSFRKFEEENKAHVEEVSILLSGLCENCAKH